MTQSNAIAWLDDDSGQRLLCAHQTPAIRSSGLTLSGLNRRNRTFWRRNTKVAKERIAIGDVFVLAKAALDLETTTKTLKDRNTFERLLAIAHLTFRDGLLRVPTGDLAHRKRLHRSISSKGGVAKKADSLHTLMLEIVQLDMEIGQTELLHRLKREEDRGVITSVNFRSGEVCFVDEWGAKRSVSNLKDRLSRVKEEIDSR